MSVEEELQENAEHAKEPFDRKVALTMAVIAAVMAIVSVAGHILTTEELLSEQGAAPEERADLLPALRRLSKWQAPQPEPADTRLLLARLTPELPALSPVRQAIREHRQHRIAFLLATARAQVSLFGLGFWLVLSLFSDLRQRTLNNDVPLPFRGLPIELISAGLMAVAFLGFTGLIKT